MTSIENPPSEATGRRLTPTPCPNGTNVYTSSGAWERLAITETILHPGWDPYEGDNDLALLRLEGPSEVATPALLNHGIDPAEWLS